MNIEVFKRPLLNSRQDISQNIHCTMPIIPKARKKSDAELSILRIKYAKHFFEIKENLFLVMEKPTLTDAKAKYVLYNDLADAFNKAVQKGKEGIVIEGVAITTDFAAFCLNLYDNIDPSFDEEAIAWHQKQIEDAKGKRK